MLQARQPNEEPLTLIDRLNARAMRCRLRGHLAKWTIAEDEQLGALLKLEEDNLWKLLAEVGKTYPLARELVPTRSAVEDLGAGIVLHIKRKWDEGKCRFFSLAYLNAAALEHVREHHLVRKPGPRKARQDPRDDSPTQGLDQLASSRDTDEEMQGWVDDRDFLQELYKLLDADEAYVLGAFRASQGKTGWQGEAADALGKGAKWTTGVKERLKEKALRLQMARVGKHVKLPNRSPSHAQD